MFFLFTCNSTSQKNTIYASFVPNFQKCHTLKINDVYYKGEVLLYIEFEYSQDYFGISKLVGKHEPTVYRIITEALDCMNKNDLEYGLYEFIYKVEKDVRSRKEMNEMFMKRKREIDSFISEHGLKNGIEQLVTIFGEPIK